MRTRIAKLISRPLIFVLISLFSLPILFLGFITELSSFNQSRIDILWVYVWSFLIALYLMIVNLFWKYARLRQVMGIGLLGVEILLLLGSLYYFEWSGLVVQNNPASTQQVKTLWDWFSLLIVPAILAIGGVLLNLTLQNNERIRAEEQAKTDHEIAENRAQDERLRHYLDRMSNLILDEELLKENENGSAAKVARVQTLTTLRGLDAERKGSVVQFLYDAELIGNAVKKSAVMNLNLADLSTANLRKTHLEGSHLERAYLRKANLEEARLEEARLEEARLEGASLGKANLEEARLEGANLAGADLAKAHLEGAHLGKASLAGARLEGANLEEASLAGAILPDGKKWTTETDMTQYTTPKPTL